MIGFRPAIAFDVSRNRLAVSAYDGVPAPVNRIDLLIADKPPLPIERLPVLVRFKSIFDVHQHERVQALRLCPPDFFSNQRRSKGRPRIVESPILCVPTVFERMVDQVTRDGPGFRIVMMAQGRGRFNEQIRGLNIVTDSLQTLCRNRSTLIVSHDLNLIRSVDRVLVISAGRVLEDGSPADLLERGGFYADLWARQSVDSSPRRRRS